MVGVILSTTTETEPSAEELAELIHEVEELGVPAVFGETTVSERLADVVATESGAKLVRLFSGSLGAKGSGAETYVEMVRTKRRPHSRGAEVTGPAGRESVIPGCHDAAIYARPGLASQGRARRVSNPPYGMVIRGVVKNELV